MRGLVVPVSPAEAAARARSLVGLRLPPPGGRAGPALPIAYALGSGGHSPGASHCAQWGKRGGSRWTADCSAASAWSLGFDRFQPGAFPGDWINTDSMLRDADRGGGWFAYSLVPQLGCLLVYGGAFRGGKRIRVGHVGVCVSVDPVRIVHCSSGASRRTGDAMSEVGPELWLNRGGKWLLYLKAA